MKITVILCTFNRCQRLVKALDSVAAQTLRESVEWEVLVVDNNSSDQTREVVEDFCRRHPGRFRYLFEPQPGKSYALNAGIREAQGDVLGFMDDDVTVEPTWLQNLTAPLHNCEWAGSAGRILPEWSCPVPSWLSLEGPYTLLGYTLALFDRGDTACELTEPPFGANMAFKKTMFEKYGGFRTNLGPRPESLDLQRGEDSEFGHRLISAGERVRYEPSAVCYHHVPEDRLQKKYFLVWSFCHGRSSIRAFGIPPDTLCSFGIPLYLFRRIVTWTMRWMVAVEPSQRFDCKLKVWVNMGQLVECYRQWHETTMS